MIKKEDLIKNINLKIKEELSLNLSENTSEIILETKNKKTKLKILEEKKENKIEVELKHEFCETDLGVKITSGKENEIEVSIKTK